MLFQFDLNSVGRSLRSVSVLIFLFAAPAYGLDDQATDEASMSKPSNGQGAAFFPQGQGTQNFFSSRNLSSGSIFSNSSLNNSLSISNQGSPNLDAVENAPEENRDSFQVPNADEANLAPVTSEVSNSQEIPEENSVSMSQADPSNLEDGVKDVMEHSRRIRQAIFGEEAASKLPVAIKHKLDDQKIKGKTEEMRF